MMKIKLNNLLLIVILGVAIFGVLSVSSSFLNVDKRLITTQINPIWNVDISSVEVIESSAHAYDNEAYIDDQTLILNPYIDNSEDSITYLVTVKNNGTYDAVLKNMNINNLSNYKIEFKNLKENDILKKGSTLTFKIIVSNDTSIDSTTITIGLDYDKK